MPPVGNEEHLQDRVNALLSGLDSYRRNIVDSPSSRNDALEQDWLPEENVDTSMHRRSMISWGENEFHPAPDPNAANSLKKLLQQELSEVYNSSEGNLGVTLTRYKVEDLVFRAEELWHNREVDPSLPVANPP